MEVYLFPIKAGMLLFLFLSFGLTTPFAIYQYRKYGYINKWRTLILFSFLFYIITAYSMVIFPLPKSRDVKSMQSPDIEHTNLKPFRFIEDIKRETKVDINNPRTYSRLLTERAFLQVVFNILLLLPLGVYLRYYFNRSLKETILISFLVSMFFELTQLSGLYGIYNAPYRIFDVDDLLANTLGGTIGYGISPILTFFLPKAEELDVGVELANKPSGYFRRFISYTIDITILKFIPGLQFDFRIRWITYFLYFIILPYLTNGKTLGSWVTYSRIKGREEKLKLKEIGIRNGLLIFGLIELSDFLNTIVALNQNTEYMEIVTYIALIQITIYFILILHIFYSLIRKKPLFYEKASGTKVILEEPKKEKNKKDGDI